MAAISGLQAFRRKVGIVMRATMHHRAHIPYYGQWQSIRCPEIRRRVSGQ
jgi:hypothetical protein